MPAKKKRSSPIQQTAIGDGNVQVVGDNNTINVNQTFIQKVSNFFLGDTEQQRAQRNRRAMLELVKYTWIKGVLEKSLYNEVLIELGMESRPSAVDHPWDMQLQMPNKANRTLPPGTSMRDVFDEMNKAILILGEPGSGKTTMLLELARDCIARAEQDSNRPIPFVFNLSSWSGPRQLIADWLVTELMTKYYISQRLAQTLLEHDDLLLLLDGLDEVRIEYRDDCVKAINSFRNQHGFTHLVICSRIADYEALNTRLNLWGAILLQPLMPKQLDEYFGRAGVQLAVIYQTLQQDPILRELARQPLMLSILTLTYGGASPKTFAHEGIKTIEQLRAQIFDTYIAKMFERATRTKNDIYTPKQFRRWLAWLSQEMIVQRQSVFYLEHLHRGWLQSNSQKRLLTTLLALILICIFGMLVAPVSWSMGDGLSLLICAPILSVVGLALGQLYGRDKPADILKWSWKRAWRGLVIGTIIGLIAGLIYLTISYSAVSLFLKDLPGFNIRDEILRLLQPELLIYILRSLLAGGGALGLVGFLLYGLVQEELRIKVIPNQGIQQSIMSMSVIWLVFVVVFGSIGALSLVFIGLVMGFLDNPFLLQSFFPLDQLSPLIMSGFIGGFIFGSIAGVLIGLYFGGYAVINHYLIRFFLYRTGYTPWNYAKFLNYCVDRIFLRRVGGGYIFVHRLLMEHFADMYPADEK